MSINQKSLAQAWSRAKSGNVEENVANRKYEIQSTSQADQKDMPLNLILLKTVDVSLFFSFDAFLSIWNLKHLSAENKMEKYFLMMKVYVEKGKCWLSFFAPFPKRRQAIEMQIDGKFNKFK